jgi:acyl-CoA synthetase (AMP-forming)/AMP-acid ligase II
MLRAVELKRLAARIPGNPVGKVADAAFVLKVAGESGLARPARPDKLARMGLTYVRWGKNPATAATLAAIRYPDETYLEDERGSLTFAEVESRSNALARALRDEGGVREGDGIAIMARNHRGFVDATLAASKLGCSTLFLNTMFAGPQISAVVEREGPKALIYDEEFSGLLGDVNDGLTRFVAWTDDGDAGDPAIEDLIASASDEPLPAPDAEARFVILTSGTTGTPKGAQRKPPQGLNVLMALIDAIPYRARERMMIAAPAFHSWGFLHFVVSLTLANTVRLRRKFDPEATLAETEDSGAQVLAVVPVMLQRILQLPDETLDRYRLPNLRITAVSGSALPGELAIGWMDRFGDSVYNLYGSTEVAYATIAAPADLRAAPGTAGRPPYGTVVRIVDEDGNDLPPGKTGRIFVGNEMAFEGYTGGGGKEALGELLSSGDVGHFDDEGRLFVDGRDDEMIVSGGENVFPREVEDLLADHDSIEEAAVIGVDDEEFGQRLKAFIVLRDGTDLDEDEVKSHVKANLAGYKVPREVEFLDSLPRNATGKVLKRELA